MTKAGSLLAGVLVAAVVALAPSPAFAAPKCLGQRATVIGSAQSETLRGTDDADVIVGRGGDDEIQGLDGRDLICGGTGKDELRGGRGRDRMDGGSGDDVLSGDTARDKLAGGPGDDRMNGGDGNDFLLYKSARAAVDVDLAAERAVGEGTDRLIAIEDAIGSRFDDELTGDDGDNDLNGLGGEDSLTGGNGPDKLIGGTGADSVDGGDGLDQLRGNKGADSLVGGPGSDYIQDTNGGNTYEGGPGNDQFFSGAGDDSIDGGRGEDLANFDPRADFEASLMTNSATGDGDDDLIKLEDLRANGTRAVTLTGDDADNILIAGTTEEHLVVVRALEGDDSITIEPVVNKGEVGDSTLFGGAGADRLEGGCQSIGGGRDRLEGGGGRDLLDGGCGVDRLKGGTGHDVLKGAGDKGKDVLNGGPGFDFAAFKDWGNGVTADLTEGVARVQFPGEKVGAPMELVELEGLKGNSQPGDDTLIGDAGPNRIFGFGGKDTIKGKGGDDKLDGGNGRDRVNGGGGDRDLCTNAEKEEGCELDRIAPSRKT